MKLRLGFFSTFLLCLLVASTPLLFGCAKGDDGSDSQVDGAGFGLDDEDDDQDDDEDQDDDDQGGNNNGNGNGGFQQQASITPQVTGAVLVPSSLPFRWANMPSGNGNWVALVPAGGNDFDIYGYLLVQGASGSGSMLVWSGVPSGSYTLRGFRGSDNVRVAISAPFAVIAPVQPPPPTCGGAGTIPMVLPNAPLAAAGFAFQVGFTNASSISGQWVGLAPVGSSDYTYVAYSYVTGCQGLTTVQIPANLSGTYEFRLYRDGGYTLIARSAPVKVVSAASSCSNVSTRIASHRLTVAPGAKLVAAFDGATGTSGQWIGLSLVGSATTSYTAWSYVNGCSGGVELSLPSSLPTGLYELRLYRDGGYSLLANTPPIRVEF